ncbi:hypothetical protein F8568_000140 [Actinomadura sp. LD22]|uniref:Uncharacterized protein n=1 Tax=Actinomadura physcomitrii TaxID=2650748 RepID=A0A6I4M7V4_9ACTN|nr:hypothetical protein [Actinomadura physcomitrii]MVZ98818.1 hypothetical protein [Actinomadura physcomitrii]
MAFIITYLLGAASALLALLAARAVRRRPPALAARDRHLAELDGVTTELGEELAALAFDPTAPGVPAESVADYRRALDAYGEATQALTAGDTERANHALATARNALTRLDARTHGLPVPIDVSRAIRGRGAPAPDPHLHGRFAYSGDLHRTYLFPIDWPRPGRPAIVEMTSSGAGSTEFKAVSITSPEAPGDPLHVFVLNDTSRQRSYLPATSETAAPGPTHFEVSPWSPRTGKGSWSLRIRPIDDAIELDRECAGLGSEVLVHRADSPALLGIHIETERAWTVRYRCLKKHRRGERCPYTSMSAVMRGSSGALKSRPICGPGYLVVDAHDHAKWSLSISARPTPPGRLTGLRKRLGL